MFDLLKTKIPSYIKIIFLFIFILVGSRFYNNYQHIQTLKREVEQKEKQILIAEERRQALMDELDNINDPKYIERIARKELGLVKPGEMLIIPIEEEE